MPFFRPRFRRTDPVVVIGLGRFGGAVAESLVRLGHEVLAVDERDEVVRQWADRLTHVVRADSTDVAMLKHHSIGDFSKVVIGIGSDIEASVLTVLAAQEAGADDIWAKANNARHGRLLHRVGAHHVVYPEHALGEQVARRVAGGMMDFVEFDDGFALVKSKSPISCVDKSLAVSAIRTRHGVTVVAVKRPGGVFESADAETVVGPADLLIVAGPTIAVEKFAASA